MNDINIYSQIIDVPDAVFAMFDKQKLMPMSRRVAKAIRKVDEKHILFLETTMASNMGIRSHIEPLADESGKRDPLQAFAPHVYDLVTDTKDVAAASPERASFIFQRHNETAERLRMPCLSGNGALMDFTPVRSPQRRSSPANWKNICAATPIGIMQKAKNTAIISRPSTVLIRKKLPGL